MSGPQRLAIFLTAIWVGFGWLANNNNTADFLFLGVFPPALVWGGWWVYQGFKQQ
jgi:hypothetical protein